MAGIQLVCKFLVKYMKLDIKLCILHPHPAPYPLSKTTRFKNYHMELQYNMKFFQEKVTDLSALGCFIFIIF
jgi:hypothetical protein